MKKVLLFVLLLIIPIRCFGKELIPNAKSGILIEANTGKIIYEKDKDIELSVASMTKMVAQIIILEEIEKGNIKWTDKVTVSRNAADMGGSQIYLKEGEVMSVEDLMKGISVASGNDATVAMAEYISGSEEKFVERMNGVIKRLGLKHTKFKNVTGLDEKEHYSSSYDMGIIARELITKHSEILRFSSIYEDYLREDTDNKFWLVNTNKLVSLYEGTDGLKTGHTDDALYCLAATVKRDDLRLIAIVLGEEDSKTRNSETMELLDYGFNTVKLKKLKDKDNVIKRIKVNKANKKYIDLYLKDNLNVVEDVGNNTKYKYKIKTNKIKLPIDKNSVLGRIDVIDKNKVITSGDLISKYRVDKLNIFELYKENFSNLIFGIL